MAARTSADGGRRLRAATRGSALARWQTDRVIELLGPDVEVEVVVVQTEGDRRTDVPISEMGGRGVFVKEVQGAVLDGRADFAVHSAKDLPSSYGAEGLMMAAVPERADPRDALVGSKFDDLPTGSLIATGSVRRRAQLAALRPDLTFTDLRGNIGTRLDKASQYGAIVMAAAALVRLGRQDAIAEVLEPEVMLPQVAQGALAVECRIDDEDLRARLARIEHGPSRRSVDAERSFLAELGGGCDLPVGAYAVELVPGGAIRLEALIATGDGRVVLRHTDVGDEPATLGRAVALQMLDGHGARALLDQDAESTR